MSEFCPYCGSASHRGDYHEIRTAPRAKDQHPSQPTTDPPLQRVEREPDWVRGALLRAWREALNVTLRSGAAAIGCSVVELSSVERSLIAIDEASWQRIINAFSKPTHVLELDEPSGETSK